MARTWTARRWAVAIGAGASIATAALAATAGAQSPSGSGSKPSGKDADVPPAYRPPPGMCRVWLNGVPPNQQPAPTDCASAVRNRPANGRVLFGDDYVGRKTGRVPHAASTLVASGPSPDEPRPDDAPVAPPESIPAATRVLTPAPRPAQDDFEAGYAAGYRDAMLGRRPRFRGAGIDGVSTPGVLGGTAAAPGGAGATAGAVVVVPPSSDPRYFNNGQYPPPGRANGVCLDRDGDGWCDDPRFGAPVCRDLDGDGRCDDYPALASAAYPSSLPEMRAGLDVREGRGSAAALRWLGTAEVVARVVNPNRTATPYRILWYDANTNALVQSWTDLDGDGVADRVEIFRNGRRVKLLGR